MTKNGKRNARSIFLAFVLLVLAVGSAQAEEFKLTLSGASPSGLWSLLGEGVNGAIAKSFPGSSVTYQTSGGGLANIALVTKGKVEMGIAHNVEVMAALKGEAPYKEPVQGMKALAYMYNWAPMQLVIRKEFAEENGIASIEDVARKQPALRIAVNQKGNMVEAMNRKIFEAAGFGYEDIEKWGGQIIYAGSKEMANLMRDRRIDMFGNGVFAPHSSIIEASNALSVDILTLSQETIKAVEDTGADAYLIPSGAYEWLTHEVPTVALGALILIREDLPEQEVYEITKALVENIEMVKAVHKSMRALTPKVMASLRIVPYHPGAERYYKEAGLR